MHSPPRCCASCGPLRSRLVLAHDYPWTSASGFSMHCETCVDLDHINVSYGDTPEEALESWDEEQDCLAFAINEALRLARGAA